MYATLPAEPTVIITLCCTPPSNAGAQCSYLTLNLQLPETQPTMEFTVEIPRVLKALRVAAPLGVLATILRYAVGKAMGAYTPTSRS